MNADDTHLIFAISPLPVMMYLSNNKSKTEFMLIGSRHRLINTFNRLLSFTVDSNFIKQVEFTKSLGVHINQNLTWNIHIEHISKQENINSTILAKRIDLLCAVFSY